MSKKKTDLRKHLDEQTQRIVAISGVESAKTELDAQTDAIMALVEDPSLAGAAFPATARLEANLEKMASEDAFGPHPGEEQVFAEEAARVYQEIHAYEAQISALNAIPNLAAKLLHAVTRDDPTCLAPVAAIAAIAAHFGLDSLGLRLAAKDFAALRGLLTAAEQEEQARRWGPSEMRFVTRCGFTRVTLADHA
jgi:hypothetical protein